jgi:hypothetical protein
MSLLPLALLGTVAALVAGVRALRSTAQSMAAGRLPV